MKTICSILTGLFLLVFFHYAQGHPSQVQTIQGISAQPQINHLHPPEPAGQLKSTWSTDQKLDSSIPEIYDKNADQFIPAEKYEYTYDELGRWAILAHFNWNQTSGQGFDIGRKEG